MDFNMCYGSAKMMTVADALKTAGYILDFIKANFDIREKKYSETLIFVKTVILALHNQTVMRPSKERMHYVVDVMHEIADMHETSPEACRDNAQIAFQLNTMIDMLKTPFGKRMW